VYGEVKLAMRKRPSWGQAKMGLDKNPIELADFCKESVICLFILFVQQLQNKLTLHGVDGV
jgi:hypothetical protein